VNVDFDNKLTGRVIGASIAVHRELGPGLDEPVYEYMLSAHLGAQAISHRCQEPLPLRYKGIRLDCGYRIDVLVEERLVVELKSVEVLLPIHEAQLLTYLRIASRELGLLINFDVPVLKQGVRRRVRSLEPRRSWTRPGKEHLPLDGYQQFEPISGQVLAAAVEVHRTLGPGLLRSAYEESLCHELSLRQIRFERKMSLPARFETVEIAGAVEIPLVVRDELPVICLSVPELTRLHQARLLARLRQGLWRSGLLINFNVTALDKGIRRVVNSG
jgi:GxxExxY protein